MHNKHVRFIVLECLCCANYYCYSWRSQQLMCAQCTQISHFGVHKHAKYSTGVTKYIHVIRSPALSLNQAVLY